MTGKKKVLPFNKVIDALCIKKKKIKLCVTTYNL